MATSIKNSSGMYYPLTKMNFVVSLVSGEGTAAFSEVTGIESTVDVIEFRQGNASSLATVKIPGLVKHGNITLKMGYIRDSGFKDWVIKCVNENREGGDSGFVRYNVAIELIDVAQDGILEGDMIEEAIQDGNRVTWLLKDAWVCKYVGPDLNATTSEVAVESIEIAYEELTVPN